ncbi:MAG: SDR family oxidoreductase [Chloroflexi bacterium]|nr:SDR family oxidoreductase [Chloroflexota bacterium]
MDLQNRVAIVTGSAHRVGKGISLALAQAGSHIVVHYGRSEEAAKACQTTIEALGVEVMLVSADLRDPEAISGMFEAVEQRFGRLDILVNSAARFDRQPFDTISVEDWERSMQVNLRAPFLATQYAARLMRRSERPDGAPGCVINIADLSGVYPWVGFAQHGVSKAGLLQLTKASAHELAPDVRVNALLLGPIIPVQGKGDADPAWQATLNRLPMGVAGGVETVGETVVHVARSDFMTGATINLDGGEGLIGSIKPKRS